MKRKLSILLALMLLFSLALFGCQSNGDTQKPEEPGTGENGGGGTGGETNPESSISGSAQEVLTALLAEAATDVGMTFEDPVTDENVEGIAGLSVEDFETYVEEAYSSTAAITTNAHLAVVFQCKDADSAGKVKDLLASGFDPARWICVVPEQCFVVDAGNYVLLGATHKDVATALQSAWTTLAGSSAGTLNVFYTGK